MMRPNRWLFSLFTWVFGLLLGKLGRRSSASSNESSPAPSGGEENSGEADVATERPRAPNWVRIRSQAMEAFSRGSWLVAMELVSHGSGAFKMRGSQFQVMKVSTHRCSSGLHTFLLLHVSTHATVRVCWLKRSKDETEEQDVLVATLFCREDQLAVASLLEACRLYEIDLYPLEGISC